MKIYLVKYIVVCIDCRILQILSAGILRTFILQYVYAKKGIEYIYPKSVKIFVVVVVVRAAPDIPEMSVPGVGYSFKPKGLAFVTPLYPV